MTAEEESEVLVWHRDRLKFLLMADPFLQVKASVPAHGRPLPSVTWLKFPPNTTKEDAHAHPQIYRSLCTWQIFMISTLFYCKFTHTLFVSLWMLYSGRRRPVPSSF